jgi:PadR family transcriptional regulator, regulatory protein PadR
MATKVLDREVKKGSAEMLVLAMLEDRQRHGYEIAKLIETRSGGAISFQAASLYPILYRLEKRGLIEGRWVEKPGERRRRFYRLTAAGRDVLKRQRSFWREFVRALDRVAAIGHA